MVDLSFLPLHLQRTFRSIFYPSLVTIKVYCVGPARPRLIVFYERKQVDELACMAWRKNGRKAEGAQRNVKKASGNRCEVIKTSAYLNFLFISFVTPLQLCRASYDRKSIASRIFAFHRFLRGKRQRIIVSQMKTSTRRDKKKPRREKRRGKERV